MTTANRVDLKVRGRYDEAVAAVGTIKPGYVVKRSSTGTLGLGPSYLGKTIPLIALGDGLRGAEGSTGRGLWDAYSSGDVVPFVHPLPGDEVAVWISIGQNITQGDRLISYGDGTVVKAVTTISTANLLNVQVAASTAIASSATETDFSRTVTIAASTLKAGDVIRLRGHVVVGGVTATPTLTVKVYLNSTVIATTGAVSVIAADVVNFDLLVTIRTITASGTFVCMGQTVATATGTATTKAQTTASTTVDCTAAVVFKVTGTWSASSSSNTCNLQSFYVVTSPIDSDSLGYFGPAFEALETYDNSAGSAATRIAALVI